MKAHNQLVKYSLALVISMSMAMPVKTEAKIGDVFALFKPLYIAQAVNPPAEANFPVAANRAPLRTIMVVATAYSSDPDQTDDTPCSPAMESYDLCDHYLKYGEEDTIAANFLSLGTKVRFPKMYGDKIFTVRDRMNSRYDFENTGYYRIDFYKAADDGVGHMDIAGSKQKAVEFGVKKSLKMEIIGV